MLIPAEEQSAGRVVDYFYRVEFQGRGFGSPISTAHPVFFFDSNYLLCNTFVKKNKTSQNKKKNNKIKQIKQIKKKNKETTHQYHPPFPFKF